MEEAKTREGRERREGKKGSSEWRENKRRKGKGIDGNIG